MNGKIPFNGIQLFYQFSGDKHLPCIVLLHGFLENSSMWNRLRKELNIKGFSVLTIDLPGHGQSDWKGESHPMEWMADGVREVIKKLSISKCIVGGHSMGGYVSLAFYDRYPELVKGIMMINSTAYADSDQKKADRDRAVKVVSHNPAIFINEAIPNLFFDHRKEELSSIIDQMKMEALKTPLQGIVNCLRGMRDRKDRSFILKEGKIPLLFIAGEFDNVIPLEKSIEQIALSETVDGKVFENSGHMSFVEEPENLEKMIMTFAEKSFKTVS